MPFLACCIMFPRTAQLCLLIKGVLANHTWTLFYIRFAHPPQFYAIRTLQFQIVTVYKWHIPTCQSCILAACWKIICISGRKDVHFITSLECHLQLDSEKNYCLILGAGRNKLLLLLVLLAFRLTSYTNLLMHHMPHSINYHLDSLGS